MRLVFLYIFRYTYALYSTSGSDSWSRLAILMRLSTSRHAEATQTLLDNLSLNVFQSKLNQRFMRFCRLPIIRWITRNAYMFSVSSQIVFRASRLCKSVYSHRCILKLKKAFWLQFKRSGDKWCAIVLYATKKNRFII